MRDEAVDFQLVTPHLHGRNAAEWEIQTSKNHFIAGLSSTYKNFPIHIWDQLILQATTNLNILRQYRINPRIYAEAQLNGPFYFNQMPVPPPGTKVVVHYKPSNWRTWDAHGLDDWYVSQTPGNYWCYSIYITNTQSEIIDDTVEFFPTHVNVPKTYSADHSTYAALEIVDALRNLAPAAPL